MRISHVQKQFARIGARAVIRYPAADRRGLFVSIDIGRDEQGEFFDIAADRHAISRLSVLDVQPKLRHLLLMSREETDKHKFLCGHDERHWFVAAVPERTSASTVQTAFDALKPRAVQLELQRRSVKPKNRNRRRNEAFVRQGEWFFVPVDRVEFRPILILRNEPLQRGGGKPHICEELVRTGGEVVYISQQHPFGLTAAQYAKAISRHPALRRLHWVVQRLNPSVFVRGKVRHPDHKTIVLAGWHRVLLNTETEAAAMRHVAFID